MCIIVELYFIGRYLFTITLSLFLALTFFVVFLSAQGNDKVTTKNVRTRLIYLMKLINTAKVGVTKLI